MIYFKLERSDIDDSILNGILSFLNKKRIWKGTMTSLNSKLIRTLGNNVILPGSPSALRVALNRIVNRLRCRGVSVKFNRANNRIRTRYVRFEI